MQAQAELKELIAQKDKIQKQIGELTTQIALLDQTKSLSKGLVDDEGFPRNDLDFGELVNYRNLKRRKAELNNDHLALMKDIESKLFAFHATQLGVKNENWSNETTQPKANFMKNKPVQEEPVKKKEESQKIDYLTPFARIDSVAAGSPAEKSGLQVGDLVSQFGEVMIYSMDWKKQIASSVKEGVPIRVIMMRKHVEGSGFPYFELKDKQLYDRVELKLVPCKWEGRGLLGCNIEPL